MHATAMAARPAVMYWQPTTLALLAEVRALRERGISAWATIDGGPHVKVLTTLDDAATVSLALKAAGATDAIISGVGGAATVVST
jgi:diphosphomevalonate decarboxylase